MGSINNICSSYLQSVYSAILQNTGLAASSSTGGTSSVSQQSDGGRLSPFARLLSSLQQLQQSDPSKYKQVTAQIGTNLQNAANTAQQSGNSTAAAQLNQLATDFTNASQNGQLPNVQDLAQAIGGAGHAHGHHHHGHHAAAQDTDAGSSAASAATSTSGTSTNPVLSQFLASLQAQGTQNALDPLAIIDNTLSSAGIKTPMIG